MSLKQADIEIGGLYELRWHDGSFTTVEILGEQRVNVRARRNGSPVIGTKTRYHARNQKTGRLVVIKSAAKLRRRVG